MKKRICPPLLLAAMLSMTACTEVLEPNVDYGSNTYINDYSALVKAVNDLQKSLEERFAALNSLLQSGMADIKLSIDENTGKISVLEATTKTGLANIDATLLDGFTAIAESIASNGDKIVTAINTNGDFIKVAINDQGKAISTEVKSLSEILNSTESGLPALVKAQGELKTAIEGLTTQEKTNAENLIKKLDELLNNEGIYVVEQDGKTDVYVEKAKWTTMSADDRTATFGNLVQETEVQLSKGAEFSQFNLTSLIRTDKNIATLQALNLQAYPDVSGSKTKQLYKLYKIPTTITLKIAGSSYGDTQDYRLCTYIITDASGKHGKYSTSGLGTAISDYYWSYEFTPTAYITKDGKIELTDGKALVQVDFYNNVPDAAKDMTKDN